MRRTQRICVYISVLMVIILSLWQLALVRYFAYRSSVAIGSEKQTAIEIADSISKPTLAPEHHRAFEVDHIQEGPLSPWDRAHVVENQRKKVASEGHLEPLEPLPVEPLNQELKHLAQTLKEVYKPNNDKRERDKRKSMQLLKHVTSHAHEEWTQALSANFSSENVYRGRVGGGRRIEKDKLEMAEEVQKLQDQLGRCGGPAVIPRTLPLRNNSEWQSFCEKVASTCGQQEPLWITKPKGGTFGTGISLMNFTGHDATACMTALDKLDKSIDPRFRPYLAQKFIGEPLIVNGDKVEVRYHVFIVNIWPYLVLYHPNFVVKQGTKPTKKRKFFQSFNVNSHQQKVISFVAEELVRLLGLGNQALETILQQLQRITRIVVTAHYQAGGFFNDERPEMRGPWGQWEVYGLDVALTKDLRAYLLDWNYEPGLGFNVQGAASQRATTIRDMYRIVLQKFKDEPIRNLAVFASQTSWKLVIDETKGKDDMFPDCRGGDWRVDLPESVAELLQAWEAKDAQTKCQ